MDIIEKIQVACVKRGKISEAELARRIGMSPQSYANKKKRGTLGIQDLEAIATALGLKLEISFRDPETGEVVS